MWLQVPIGESR